MESKFQCPFCKNEVFGVLSRNAQEILCPICLKEGKVHAMCEQKSEKLLNLGGGLFNNKKL